MPFLAIVALIGAAVSLVTVVQGIRTDNKDMVRNGMFGLFSAGVGGAMAGVGTAATAASTAAAAAPEIGVAAAGSQAAVGSNFANAANMTNSGLTLAQPGVSALGTAGNTLGSVGTGASGLVGNSAVSAVGQQAASEPLQLTDMGGPSALSEEAGMLGKIGDAAKGAVDFAKDNPELIKGVGTLAKGYFSSQAQQRDLEAIEEENARRRADVEDYNARRNAVGTARSYQRAR